MRLFSKPEVVILKDSCDSREYLARLQELRTTVPDSSVAAEKIDKEIAITEAGVYGEDSILFELKNSGMDLVVIRDLYIQTEDGRSAQIDFFVITPYANVIIECKNLFGNIEINNNGDFIRSFEYKGRKFKEGIYSPITQNERHMLVYKECKKTQKNAFMGFLYDKNFDTYNKSIIVFANPKTVVNDRFAKKEVKDQVIRCDHLISYLKDIKTDIKTSPKEMREYGEKVLALNVSERTDYIQKFETMLEETKAYTQDIKKADTEKTMTEDCAVCPRCGGKLVLRTAKRGDNKGNQFYGCSNYPKCRYIQNL